MLQQLLPLHSGNLDLNNNLISHIIMKNELCDFKDSSGLVVGIGELLWDKLPEGKKIGGAPTNFAFHVSQFGLTSYAVSAIGNDADGEELLKTINEKNIKSLISIVDFPTGTVDVTISGNGIPSYEIHTNVAWDNIPMTDTLINLAKNTSAVCFGSLAQRSQTSRNTIAKFIEAMPKGDKSLKIFDINLRQEFYSKEIIDQSLNLCNILKINDAELKIIAEMYSLNGNNLSDWCKELISLYNLTLLILTCGENGSYIFTHKTESFLHTPTVEVADTVGAGDSFTAAFTASLLCGASINEAHKKAVEVSAFVCTQHGAMPQLPKHLVSE